MAIPDYQTLMLPLLRLCKDGKEHSLKEATQKLSRKFQLSEKEKYVIVPSGRQPIFENRIGWAKLYMHKAGLLETTGRGSFRITSRGLKAIEENKSLLSVRYLKDFPEFLRFRKINPPKNSYLRENKKP